MVALQKISFTAVLTHLLCRPWSATTALVSLRTSALVHLYSCALILLCTCALFSEVKVTPVASAFLGGGQYFLENNNSFGGNIDLYLCPVVNFSKDTALLPMYIGSYRGTKDVRELVGGGTITQEVQNHNVNLKFVTKFSETLKFGARAGYKLEYLKETKDERWAKGLFDYSRPVIGVEFEKIFGGNSLKAGLDYSIMTYPNYQSLISKDAFKISLDTTTYRELSTNAGKNVLDTSNISFALSWLRAISESSHWRISNDFIYKNFMDQKVVKDDGSFSDALRTDMLNTLGGSYNLSFSRLRMSIADSIRFHYSNQNSYDAKRTKYIPSHYNFIENLFIPSLTFYLGEFEPYTALSLFTEFSNRFYLERLAQNSSGEYLSEKTHQSTQTAGISLNYPLFKGLSAKLTSSYRTTSSNMKYEGNYKYNYSVFNYFLGINWEL